MQDVSMALDFLQLQGKKKHHLGPSSPNPTAAEIQSRVKAGCCQAHQTAALVTVCLADVKKRFAHFYEDDDYILAATIHPQYVLY